ncbi:hypothetical protein JCM12178A_20620 [Salidesulfovibrio brasiliensis]
MLKRKGRWLAMTLAAALLMAVPVCASAAVEEDGAPGRRMAIQATKAKPIVRTITADHSKFKELQFDPEQEKTMRPEEVTQTCLKCHNQAALQFHQTIHWTWRDFDENGKPTDLGKGGLSVNNF